MESSTATGSVWMNAAFVLDEQHPNADFRDVAAAADVLERQQLQYASPESPPSAAGGLNTLYAFLTEMEQLDEDEISPRSQSYISPWSLVLDPRDPAIAQATAIGASVAMENNFQKTKPKKKKLSTHDRTRQEKAALLQDIDIMEQEIQQIKRAHYEKFAQLYAKRWEPIIQHEVNQKEKLEEEQFELRRHVDEERQRWHAALELIEKMRAFLQASSTAYVRVPQPPQLESEKDVAIFKMLAWSVGAKIQVLDHVLPKNSSTTEMSFGKVSSDGMVAEHEFVRIVPFDVPTTSNVSWECAKIDFGSGCAGLNRSYAADTLSFKQELMVPISNLHNVRLKIRSVCKKFVSEGRTVILWEGLSQWMTSQDSMITTTHEQGSIVFEPLQFGDGLSTVKGFSRLAPVNMEDSWVHLVQNTNALTRIVLPSYEKLIDARHQYVENRLMDASNRSVRAFSTV